MSPLQGRVGSAVATPGSFGRVRAGAPQSPVAFDRSRGLPDFVGVRA